MKKLSDFEKKHLLLGLLLMCGSVIFYVICTKGISSVNVFRIFFPVFWGLYTVITIAYVVMASWLKKRELGEDNIEVSEETRAKELSKRRFLLIVNIITAVTMVVGYVSSTIKNASIQYSTYQPLAWTLAICVEIAMYVIYLFREDKLEVVKEEENIKAEGVQLVSYEEAVRILEEQGYEIEGTVPNNEEDSKEDEVEKDVAEPLPAEDNDIEKIPEETDTTEKLESSENKTAEISVSTALPAVKETAKPKNSRNKHRYYKKKRR